MSEKSLSKAKPFSLYDTNDITHWLTEKGFNTETIEIITNNLITGYDLVSFTEEDFKQLSIPIQHDYYLLLKEIQDCLFNDLKITISFEEKSFAFELENDLSYLTENLCSAVTDIFQLQGKIFLRTEDGDILLPNVRIVQRMLINPKKYEKLMIVKSSDSPIKPKDKGYSSIDSLNKKEFDMIPLIPNIGNSANLDVEYNTKKIADQYPYQPLPNQDIPYSSLTPNQHEMGQEKADVEYSSKAPGLSTVNYQSYVGKTEERDKDVMYSFSPQDNLIDKSDQESQPKPKSKAKDEPYQSTFNTKNTKSNEKEAKPQIANKEELKNYNKIYGNYDKLDMNIEDNTDDTHQLLQEKEDMKRLASEERNYRLLNINKDNKLEDYQPKQFSKYPGAGNYSSVDKFNRLSNRQPGYQSSLSSTTKETNVETGYSPMGYQNKLSSNLPQKEGEGGSYSFTFDLRNKVNDLRSQISNYTREQKLPDPMVNYSDLKLRGNV